jgi:hypothetical protein
MNRRPTLSAALTGLAVALSSCGQPSDRQPLQPDRPVRDMVVDQGNRAFETPDGRWRIAELFDQFLAWSLNGNRQTEVSVLR